MRRVSKGTLKNDYWHHYVCTCQSDFQVADNCENLPFGFDTNVRTLGVREGGWVVGHCRQQSSKGGKTNILNAKTFSGLT